ncbi:hypothetical protein HG536_0H02250 [Torulaspora globosa]|uniref:Autophagy-related protein 32 n=1 Tax=Torulaspora globosa TaxID=48254 RepID=A0A7G3ZMW4_9SACH|nr:uncharacterized protein HG536_0H02250 [Torulaspora globosa]QLL34850.1 hypothetical protein HG536_0H02250 [Torulaspora globosa]
MSCQYMASGGSRSREMDGSMFDVNRSSTSLAGGTLGGEAAGNDNTETTAFERKSLLNPHLSVLELLQGNRDSSSGDERVLETSLGGKGGVSSDGSKSISDSWQAIHRNEALISVVPERCSSQANAVGILSSSDTSEEEFDPAGSPNVAHHGQLHLPQQAPAGPRSLPNLQSIKMEVPVVFPVVERAGRGDGEGEGDDETLTKSLSNSSNSFVMPKLSLSQKSHKLRILILGRPGTKFYQSIPKRYQHFFELSQLQDPSEFRQFTGILIVFRELKEMVSLLNRVCQCTPTRPIIPVCQTGQHQQVRNVLESLLKNKLISLLYPPVVISNHSDLNNMFRFLQDLSRTISDNSDDEDEECEVTKQAKKSYQRKKKKLPSHDKSKPRRRKDRDERVSKWVLWGISLTVGVGVGYCMSYFASSALVSMNVKSMPSIDGGGDNLVVFEHSSLSIGEYDHDLENPFAHALYLFKQTLKQWNSMIKQFISKHLHFVEQMSFNNHKDWSVDDNSNRILALGYILL